jgi:hypothetical protein
MTTYAVAIGDAVRVMLSSRSFCPGVVEVLGDKIGVRLVNGNFRWCGPDEVVGEEPRRLCRFCKDNIGASCDCV